MLLLVSVWQCGLLFSYSLTEAMIYIHCNLPCGKEQASQLDVCHFGMSIMC